VFSPTLHRDCRVGGAVRLVAAEGVAGLRHGDVAAGGLQGLRPARRGGALAVRAGPRRGVLPGRGGALRRGGRLRGQLAVRVPLHGGARPPVQLQCVRHRTAAGALRRPAARRQRRRRRHPHVLHKVYMGTPKHTHVLIALHFFNQ